MEKQNQGTDFNFWQEFDLQTCLNLFRSGKVIVVAYYEPKGNIPGCFHDNVLPPAQEDSSDTEEDSEKSDSKSASRRSSRRFLLSSFLRRRKTSNKIT